MKRAIPLLLLGAAVFCDANPTASVSIRGKDQSIAVLPAAGTLRGAVLFLPGDGGWRGLAVNIAETVSRWGYDVYGFDTKKYLEGFTDSGVSALTPDRMRQDMAAVVNSIHARGAASVTLLGWSQGAGIHGDRDEYTKPNTALALYKAAPGPKRLVTVRGANHRFDMARGELYKSVQEGLSWIQNGGH